MHDCTIGECKADDVAGRSHGCDHAIVSATANSVPQPSATRATIRSLPFSKKPEPKQNFKRETHTIDPSPGKPAPPKVMPQTNESENDPHAPDLRTLATQRYVHVSYDPFVESRMPESPEAGEGIIVVDAVLHVFACEDAIHQ